MTPSSFPGRLVQSLCRSILLAWSSTRLGRCNPGFIPATSLTQQAQSEVQHNCWWKVGLFFLSTIATHLTPSFFFFFLPFLSSSSFTLYFVPDHVTIISSLNRNLCHLFPLPVHILHTSHQCSTGSFCLTLVTWSFFDFAEPPQFIQKLPPATFVKLCEGHRFECKATSARSLKMCWYKNDQKITEGNNYKVMFVDSTAYLQLRTTRFEDNGVYTCEAQNDAGSVSCSTVLTVQGQLLKPHMDVCGF